MEPFTLSRIKCQLVIYPNGSKPGLKGYFILHLFMDFPELIPFYTNIWCQKVFYIKCMVAKISNGEYEY